MKYHVRIHAEEWRSDSDQVYIITPPYPQRAVDIAILALETYRKHGHDNHCEELTLHLIKVEES